MKKILLTGPESSGKTTLAKALAHRYNGIWVPEYARLYLEKTAGNYQEEDLLAIAQGQMALENAMSSYQPDFLFCDTGMLVMKTWSEVKYGRCHPWIEAQWNQSRYDLYLLCGIDIPWQEDPLREHPKEREYLYKHYLNALRKKKVSFLELEGSLEARLACVKPMLLNA
ncbi:MAG TPA: ATP-binding protein [Saprospiraceae bacterium]|nr:ATP-binding protein [Saprospiraceae bacterium]HMQ82709.1 ATP-binding protein [Saprospiraceae bacterium]